MKQSDDGVFFISFTDYMNYYRSTTICKVHEGYTTKYIKVDTMKPPFHNPRHQKPYQIINISLKEPSKIMISVH